MDFAQAYEGLRRSYEQGLAMGDPIWVAALYAEDAVLLAPGSEPMMGRDAIRAHEQTFLDAFKIEMSIEPADVVEHAEKGWGYGSFKGTLTPKSGGAPVEVTGKYLNVVQLRQDGTLEIVRHCWNSDQPIPTPPAG
jgi:ketosteroid isomerase-like protein